MNKIDRRSFVRLLAGGFTAPLMSRIYPAEASTDKNLLLVFQATGAWDVAAFCDPKENSEASQKITKWSDTNSTQMAGNIPYAPFSTNSEFFEKHHKNMLVVNGVEMQTNAHGIGNIHAFSGRLARGYPSLTALYSASYGIDLPLAHISMGGFSDTGGILTPVVTNGRSLLRYARQNLQYFDQSLFNGVLFLHGKTALSRINDVKNIPGNVNQYGSYLDSITNSAELEKLLDVQNAYPSSKFDGVNDSILTALIAYKAGLSLSADFSYGGFDTHDKNDEEQAIALADLTSGINYAVDKARELGIADKITIIVGSDFSRSPNYNSSDDGKDHWSIGSYIVIEENAQFGNTVIGATTGDQVQLKINPHNFSLDDEGLQLLPQHIHQELRRHLGIAGNKFDALFPLNVKDEINFLT
ncbi:MAG: hypothetical protein ACI9LY_002588 [Arenicella sp.]|jgi:hypothetical protein